MDQDTAQHLLKALQECGEHSPQSLAVAERLLANVATIDDAVLSETLLKESLVTIYMARKIRVNRTFEILFGPFLILEKIGEGGMGKVYRAIHLPRKQMVALKVVRQHLMNNKTVKQRYKKEAAAAAALDHQNIVKLFDADEINNRYYIAMEYVEGVDLARLVKEYGNPPTIGLASYQEAVEYVRQAALGLQHAHDRGLIHRDIKPSNLLVQGERALPDTNGQAIVKVLDMGLVRSILDSDDHAQTELTRDGTVVGTPDYMSPEQAKNSSTVDARADQYSLGCTLFYLLRGRPPYPDGTPIDKLLRHQLDPIPDLKQDRPDLPTRLWDVIRKMMAKRPEERYADMNAVAEALAPFTSPEPVPEHEPFDFSLNPSVGVTEPHTLGQQKPIIPDATTTVVKTEKPAVAPKAPAVRLRVVQTAKESETVPPASARTPPHPPPAAPVVASQVTPQVTPQAAPMSERHERFSRDEATPSSESLPGLGFGVRSTNTRTPVRTKTVHPKSTRISTSTKATASETYPPRRAFSSQRPAKQNPRRRLPAKTWFIFGSIAAAMLFFLTIAGVLLWASKQKRTEATSPSNEPTIAALTPATQAESPVTATNPVAVKKLSWEEFVPPDCTAALVIRPNSFFETLRYATTTNPTPRLNLRLAELVSRWKLDARRCTQAVISFSGPDHHTLAVVTGPFLTPNWGADLGDAVAVLPTSQPQLELLKFNQSQAQIPDLGLLAKHDFLLISQQESLLRRIIDADAKPYELSESSRQLLTLIIRQARSNEKKPAIFEFLAGPEFCLTDGTPLNKLGVTLLQLSIFLEGLEFRFRLVVEGETGRKLDDFISINISTMLPEEFPAVKVFVDLLGHAEVQKSRRHGKATYEATARMPWTSAVAALETLLN